MLSDLDNRSPVEHIEPLVSVLVVPCQVCHMMAFRLRFMYPDRIGLILSCQHCKNFDMKDEDIGKAS